MTSLMPTEYDLEEWDPGKFNPQYTPIFTAALPPFVQKCDLPREAVSLINNPINNFNQLKNEMPISLTSRISQVMLTHE